ncbi:MAG: PQQ-like beta-propeller repeat protein, partial [Myxococcales bacterium]|nr:PQQ-like beta-propeller repeat protein [Myxococcales bacterium]
GRVQSPAGNEWLVRALDTRTGALLWDIAEPGAGIASHVAIKGKRVFVAGSRDNGIDEDFFVAAYDARTGALLWSDQQNPDAGDMDGASRLAVKGSLLVAVGSLRNGINTDWYVRAYRAKTGEFLWEERFDADGSTDYASDVAIQGKRVFVAGSTLIGGDREFLVRAYDARTGGELWSDLFDLAGGGDGASRIAVKGRRVFAAGQVDNGSDSDVLLRTLDAKTGGLLWDDLHDRAGGGENVNALVVKGGRLYMSGAESNGLDGDAFVRIYSAKSGFLESEDVLDLGGNERGNEIALRGKTVFQAAIASEQYLVRILGLP